MKKPKQVVDPKDYLVRNPACMLCKRCENVVHINMWGRGNPQAKYFIVLDTPSRSADFQRSLLDPDMRRWMYAIFEQVGINFGVECYITHAVKCGGENKKKPNAESIRACNPYLLAEIATIKPELVIGMGPIAASALLGKQAAPIKKLRNRVHTLADGTKAGFTFSPRLLALEPGQIQTIVDDINFLLGRNQHEQVLCNYEYNRVPTIPVDTSLWGFDIETKSLVPQRPDDDVLTASLAYGDGSAFGFELAHGQSVLGNTRPEREDYINRIVTNPAVELAGHTIKFDILFWETKYNVECTPKIFDIKVAATLLDENAPDKSLKHLVSAHTDMGHYEDSIDKKNLNDASLLEVLRYNTADADGSRRLVPILRNALRAEGLEPIFNFSMEAERTLIEIERTGVWIDKAWAAKVGVDTFNKRESAREKIFRIARREINFDAPQQVGSFLYDCLGLPVLAVTKEGQPRTDKENIRELTLLERLSPLQSQGLGALNEFKTAHTLWKKYFSTLYDYLKYDGRVHTTYNLGKGGNDYDDDDVGTVTGRLSSSNPNLQNIPIGSSMRGMFSATGVCSDIVLDRDHYNFLDGESRPSEWGFIGADYSQLEIRVAAFVAQEPALMRLFDEGLDVHTGVLADLKNISYKECLERLGDKNAKDYLTWKTMRVAVKRVNFGVLYGIGFRKLTRQLRAFDVFMPEEEVRTFMEKWFARYKKVTQWITATEDTTITTGQVRCPFGRVRHLIGASRKTDVGTRMLRQAVNTPIQATASEICLVAMILLDRKFSLDKRANARLLLQVHDMLGIEHKIKNITPEKMQDQIKHTMEVEVKSYIKDHFNVDFNIPLAVDIDAGERWS